MEILAIITGEYGLRHVENIRQYKPEGWQVHTWRAPVALPAVIDEPEEFLPPALPQADLLLSFAEYKGAAELLPEIARRTGARAVIVAVDNETWLPHGLRRQLIGWLAAQGVACATPRPLCSLTETDYGITRRERQRYASPEIAGFARYFGAPDVRLSIAPQDGTITAAEVHRDAVCGCARYVAERLVGLPAAQAEEKATLLHHHYPCLASMVKLDDFDHETLMMESGYQLLRSLQPQLASFAGENAKPAT